MRAVAVDWRHDDPRLPEEPQEPTAAEVVKGWATGDLPVGLDVADCWPAPPSTSRNSAGYARVSVDGRREFAHRAAWCWSRNLPPDFLLGSPLQIDHSRRLGCSGAHDCVNPHHLELVTAAENKRRGGWGHIGSQGRRRGRKVTECKYGHPREEFWRTTPSGCGYCTGCQPLREAAKKAGVSFSEYMASQGYTGRRTLIQTILDAVVEPPEGCLLLSPVAEHRGVTVSYGGKMHSAHRLALAFSMGLDSSFDLPKGLQVDHVAERGCWAPGCCNPAHLELVTPSENGRRRAHLNRTHLERPDVV